MKWALDEEARGGPQSRGSGAESASDKARERMGGKRNPQNPDTEQLGEKQDTRGL